VFDITKKHLAIKGKVLYIHFIEQSIHFRVLLKKRPHEHACAVANRVFDNTRVGAKWDHSWRGKTGLSPVLPRLWDVVMMTVIGPRSKQ